MKLFMIIATIVTVASACKPSPNPSPITAADITQILEAIISGLRPEPVGVGPAIIDLPVPDGGVIADVPVIPDTPLDIPPSPVDVVPGPVTDVATTTSPLVQIVLNINLAAASATPIAPVVLPEAVKPTPVHVVEFAPEPVHVVDGPAPIQVIETAPIAINPIGVVEVAPGPVQVVEDAIVVEPVIIGTPTIPAPAFPLPEELN